MDVNEAPGGSTAGAGDGASDDVTAAPRDEAATVLANLSAPEREALIIQCWMSHDARWFMAAAMTCGLETAQRINRLAVREEGRVEAGRLSRRLGLPAVLTVRDYLLLQESVIGLLGPDLLDYRIEGVSEDGFDIEIDRCFAFDNVTKAGIADQYECGILPRLLGWLDYARLDYALTPEPGVCLMAQNMPCRYSFRDMRPRDEGLAEHG
jgi:hypothetical protein